MQGFAFTFGQSPPTKINLKSMLDILVLKSWYLGSINDSDQWSINAFTDADTLYQYTGDAKITVSLSSTWSIINW